MRLLWHHRVPQHTAVKESWDLRVTVESSLRKNTGKLLVSGESLVLFSHSKDLKQQTTVTARSQLSFIWQAKEWGWGDPRDAKRSKEKPSPSVQFWLLLLYVFSSPPDLHYVYWASQKGCLFYLRSSLWSSDLPLFYFQSFSFLCLLATSILDSFFLF